MAQASARAHKLVRTRPSQNIFLFTASSDFVWIVSPLMIWQWLFADKTAINYVSSGERVSVTLTSTATFVSVPVSVSDNKIIRNMSLKFVPFKKSIAVRLLFTDLVMVLSLGCGATVSAV